MGGPAPVATHPAETREDVLALLTADASEIRRRGATALYVYGSAARDEMHRESDVDLFVEFDPEGAFSLIELIGLEHHLKKLLGRNIDLTTRNGLHPLLRSGIERDSVRVF